MELRTNKLLTAANKVTYLVEHDGDDTMEKLLPLLYDLPDDYPKTGVARVLGLLSAMPDVETNGALWLAQELGWLSEPKDTAIEFLAAPETYQFDASVNDLIDILVFNFNKLERNQLDLEEHQLGGWVQGYPPYDILIALHYLLANKILASYEIQDVDITKTTNTYIFYTTFAHLEDRWGEKAFKTKPVQPKLKKKGTK